MAAGQVIYTPQHIVLNPMSGAGATPDAAPSSAIMGYAVADPRVPFAPGSTKAGIQGFVASGRIKSVGFNPSTAAAANIAAVQHITSGTAMTLVSSTGAGITVLATPFLCEGSGNTIPAGSLVIDGLPTPTTFGQGFVSSFYNPSGMLARAVSITAVASATGGAILIKGADVYGYPMSQSITSAASTTVNSLKAFKFIFSAVPTFTDSSHNYSIGTADIFGFALIANQFCDAQIYWNNALQVFAQYTAPDVTVPATTATGDVRGTFTPTASAADGTKRLEVFQALTLGMLSNASLAVGMFGQPQV